MERATTKALDATRETIENGFAIPSTEQARVVGVTSVVEGVKWKLSTDQLQVFQVRMPFLQAEEILICHRVYGGTQAHVAVSEITVDLLLLCGAPAGEVQHAHFSHSCSSYV